MVLLRMESKIPESCFQSEQTVIWSYVDQCSDRASIGHEHSCQVLDLKIRDQQSHLSRGQSHVSGGWSQKQKWAEQQCKLQAGSGSERSKEEGSHVLHAMEPHRLLV